MNIAKLVRHNLARPINKRVSSNVIARSHVAARRHGRIVAGLARIRMENAAAFENLRNAQEYKDRTEVDFVQAGL